MQIAYNNLLLPTRNAEIVMRWISDAVATT
jgi:hypothetical protein